MDLLKMPGVVYCEFKKKSYIIRQGEKVDSIYYLVSGTCYRTAITEKGDEIIYGVKESNNNLIYSLLGVLVLYSDGISTNQFVARSNCCCYKIPKEVFFQYVQDKPEILTQMLYMAMWELRELAGSFQARQEGKVANRLCNLLLKNAQTNQGKRLIDKGYSNSEISRFLGIHKVTVARILRVLKEEGIIDKQKEGIIILDEKRLENYAKAEKMMDY
ncbi:Crp/Fnr family transcriptional regulator [Desulfosporosinus nitroreducens]|uniref:Crp/Fnr family transcriptional regulator n=1 Tax=Desulfosporosinus nitroreducens TaxID=2018668 RepID=A0ABT8QNY5_9FIRM|nr:Crp/Fnr family transcriptional regulator [Desulfosporosinus nitroreducens]MCO1600693.1 Crp/Fnr family transcriptional regulator [Desulfosporosinus nitroreducens]MDO0822345.1 Crp/Fnr family transcriptional regulator [Desulfosporosinus nitroreducens]